MKRYLLLVVLVAAFRVVLAVATPVSGDEAYYWDCSRHLAWSYFDQPPLVIWAMIPFRAALGETALAVRAPAIVAGILLAVCLLPLMRRLGGGAREAAAAYLLMQAMPLYLLGGAYASTDVAMVTAYVGATWAAVAVAQGERRAWWGFAAACGIGFLAKFPVVLVVPALLVALLGRAARGMLRTATPYLAGALSLLLTAPVWIWGARHDWANIAFQLYGRHTREAGAGYRQLSGLFGIAGPDGPRLKYLLEFVAATLALATPFLFVAMLLALWRALRGGAPREDRLAWWVLAAAFASPLLAFGLSSLTNRVGGHWGAPALALGAVAIARVAFRGRRWWIAAGAVTGPALSAAVLFVALRPEALLALPALRSKTDAEVARSRLAAMFGNHEIVDELSRRVRPGELVVSDSYSHVHLFALLGRGRLDTRLANVSNGLHGLASLYWHPPSSLAGADALFVTDEPPEIEERVARLFAECRPEEPLRVFRRGRLVRELRALRCTDLHEPVPAFTLLEPRRSRPPTLAARGDARPEGAAPGLGIGGRTRPPAP